MSIGKNTSRWLGAAADWLSAVIYCHDNARDLMQLQLDMGDVLDKATDGRVRNVHVSKERIMNALEFKRRADVQAANDHVLIGTDEAVRRGMTLAANAVFEMADDRTLGFISGKEALKAAAERLKQLSMAAPVTQVSMRRDDAAYVTVQEANRAV